MTTKAFLTAQGLLQSETDYVFSASNGNLSNGQTSFTIPGGYFPNRVDAYLNGIRLTLGEDVTVSSGTAVVLAVPADLEDVLVVKRWKAYQVADLPVKASGTQASVGTDDTTFLTPAKAALSAALLAAATTSTTVFNADQTISKTVAGVTVTTTFNADGTITRAFGAPINKSIVTTFSGLTISEA